MSLRHNREAMGQLHLCYFQPKLGFVNKADGACGSAQEERDADVSNLRSEEAISDGNLSDAIEDLEEYIENKSRPAEKILEQEKFPDIAPHLEEFLEDAGSPEESQVMEEVSSPPPLIRTDSEGTSEVEAFLTNAQGSVNKNFERSHKVNFIDIVKTNTLFSRLSSKPSTPTPPRPHVSSVINRAPGSMNHECYLLTYPISIM